MNFFIALFFVFCVPFSVRAADLTPDIERISVKMGDIVTYPLNAEPLEVEAEINGLQYICTIMPGDSFEVMKIFGYAYNADGRGEIKLQKREGTPGNHEICHKDSSIDVMGGAYEVEKSEDGVPQRVNKMYSPFVSWSDLEDIQRRKRLPTTLSAVETETILFKLNDIIEYPLDADFIEVESGMDRLDFRCTEAPGDFFSIGWFINYNDGVNIIGFRKKEGTPGDQEICPIDSSTSIRPAECVLKRTEEGIPEGLLCSHSLKTLFNSQE